MSSTRARLDRSSMPEPNSGCVLWLDNTNPRGYGMLRWRGKVWTAHRLSYVDAYGSLPVGRLVLHKCDVPGCINPAHLWAGTQSENMKDMSVKGRAFSNKGNSRAHITTVDARAIFADQRPHKVLAAAYGLSLSQVEKIKAGVRWRSVTTRSEAA